MKLTITLVILFISFLAFGQTTSIPDEYFEQELIDLGIDSDETLNGLILTEDIINVETLNLINSNISDLSGLQEFSSLKTLIIINASELESIDLTSNTELIHLEMDLTNITSLDVTQNTALVYLNLEQNSLTSIDVSQNILLEELILGNHTIDIIPANSYTNIDITQNTLLRHFSCQFCGNIDSIDFSMSPNLEIISVVFSELNTIDVSQNTELQYLILGRYEVPDYIFGISNNLETVDLSNNPDLIEVQMQNTNIHTLNLKNGDTDNIEVLKADVNPNLNCILVDNEDQAASGTGNYANWIYDEEVTSFSDTECVLSVSENYLQELKVYPNPVTNRLFVQSNQPLQHLAVYNLSGQLLRQSEQSQFINVSSLASGLYIVKLTTLEGIRHVQFIKE